MTDRLPSVSSEGEINYISVSQLKTANACLTKWWFEKVAHVPGPPKLFLETGIKVHSELEEYLKTGVDALGDIARSGKQYLPRPGSDLLVEHRFDSQSKDAPFIPANAKLHLAGVPLDGYIDLINPRDEACPEVLDHKTSSNLKRYGTPAAKFIDPTLDDTQSGHWIQMVGYGVWAMTNFGAERVRLSQIGYQTGKTRKATYETVVAPYSLISRLWDGAANIMLAMLGAAKEKDVANVPGNTRRCQDYGGCPYQAICPHVGTETGLLDALSSDMLDTVKPEGAAPMDDLLASLMGSVAAVTPPKDSVPPQAADVEYQRFLAAKKIEVAAPAPSSPVTFAVSSPVAAPPPTAPASPITFVAATPVAPSADIVEAPKRGPGRPKRVVATNTPLESVAEIEARVAAAKTLPPPAPPLAALPVVTPVVPALISPAETKAAIAEYARLVGALKANGQLSDPRNTPAPAGKLELLINCSAPNALRLEDYVARQVKRLEDKFKVPDIRCAPSKLENGADHPLSFGKWAGALALCVKTDPPPPGRYSVYPDGAFVSAVLEALIPMVTAGDVIRGR